MPRVGRAELREPLRHVAVAEEHAAGRTPASPWRARPRRASPRCPVAISTRVDDGAEAEQRRPGQRQLAHRAPDRGQLRPARLGAVERGDDEARERPADHDRAGEDDRVARPGSACAGRRRPPPCRCATAMNAAEITVANRPPMRVDHRLRARISRSIDQHDAERRPPRSPRCSDPGSRRRPRTRSAPSRCRRIARLSRSMSTGLGGCSRAAAHSGLRAASIRL